MVGARPRSAELGSSRASRASLCSAQGIFEKAKLPQKWIGIPSGHCSSPAGNIRIVLCSMTLYCKNSSSSSLASKFYTCKGKNRCSGTCFHAMRPALPPSPGEMVSSRPLGWEPGGRAMLVPTIGRRSDKEDHFLRGRICPGIERGGIAARKKAPCRSRELFCMNDTDQLTFTPMPVVWRLGPLYQ